MKQKLVALLLVSVMVASAFSAISLSATKVDALVGTTLTLTASTTTPLSGQSYTLSGSLSDSTGTALANKPIDIWVRHDGDNGILWKTMTTDSNGRYSTTATSTQKAYIRTMFKGDSAYAGSRSDLVTVTPRLGTTTLTLTASTTTPLSGQSYTLSGSLTDSTGKALANKPIDIWVRHDGDNGILWKTMTTDSSGKYSTTATSTKKAYIRTVFNGDSAYAGSRSDLVTVTPTSTAKPTAIDFSDVPAAVANQPTTVTASITGGAETPCMSGLTVSMYYNDKYAGQVVTTTCNGVFVFLYPGLPAGTYQLTAIFAGNAQYAPSSGGPVDLVVV